MLSWIRNFASSGAGFIRMTRIYRVLSCIDAPDGVHRVTIEESHGLFRFVASIFISESDVEDGDGYDYW
jgi:hypothetical protein